MLLSASADIADNVDLLGKSASDLQSNIEIRNGVVYGTLKKVTGYTGFSGAANEQSGNYIALKIDVPDTDADSVTVQLIGGNGNTVTLGEDRLIVLKIRNTDQQIKITASADGKESVTKILALTGLTLEG